MEVKQWEKEVLDSRKNLWLVTTKKMKLVCKKLEHGIFLIKGKNELVCDEVISSEKL